MNEIRILSPQGMLGYGYPLSSLEAGLEQAPHVIAVDAGSTDGGPHRLGQGIGGVSRFATKKDLEPLITSAKKRGIPVIIGSAGSSGANCRVDWMLDIVNEIALEQKLTLKVATIYADQSTTWLGEQWKNKNVTAVGSAPALTAADIEQTGALVAQMGVEPYLHILQQQVDIIIGGRTYDPVMTAALPLLHGMDAGLSWHMGKILECGALAAQPGSAKDGMLGIIRDDHFLVRPLNPMRRCTTQSVAAHTLYEKSHPYLLPGPGGRLDLSQCQFEQVDEQTVKVSGSQFIPASAYTLKLEGVRSLGYRTVLIAAARDPFFIKQFDPFVEQVKQDVASYFEEVHNNQAQLFFKAYGVDGVMGDWEPVPENGTHELCIILEVVAESQELANSICAYTRAVMMHLDYEGRVSTAGNLALPFAPPEFAVGEVFTFSVYHTVTVEDPVQLFPIRWFNLGGNHNEYPV